MNGDKRQSGWAWEKSNKGSLVRLRKAETYYMKVFRMQLCNLKYSEAKEEYEIIYYKSMLIYERNFR